MLFIYTPWKTVNPGSRDVVLCLLPYWQHLASSLAYSICSITYLLNEWIPLVFCDIALFCLFLLLSGLIFWSLFLPLPILYNFAQSSVFILLFLSNQTVALTSLSTLPDGHLRALLVRPINKFYQHREVSMSEKTYFLLRTIYHPSFHDGDIIFWGTQLKSKAKVILSLWSFPLYFLSFYVESVTKPYWFSSSFLTSASWAV